MDVQKLHYENISGLLIRREGVLSWRCPLCKAEGQSSEVMRCCPECGSKEAALPGAQPAPKAVAYLDLGVGGYMDIGSEKIQETLRQQQEINLSDPAVQKRLAAQWGYVPADAQPAPTALVGARKVTRDFRWDSVTQCHVPMLKVEFEPIPVEAPSDAKGWRDQARIAAMLDEALAAAPEAKP